MIEYQVHLDLTQATLRTLHRDAEYQRVLAQAVQPDRALFRLPSFRRWLHRPVGSHS
ncbi:hypothetical protein [Deinococcus sonorensis]|uniref:Uncharacterized protein n=1 Tax=Deinococcus sonorensis TaxID=309891 RepID=A0ABV8YBD3_9DEIO